jgi:hypothetical protein
MMRPVIASRIMARTTLDIDLPILKELKALREREGKSLGRLVSELVAEALAARKKGLGKKPFKLKWHSKAMGPLIDIGDPRAIKEFLAQEDIEKFRRLSQDVPTKVR